MFRRVLLLFGLLTNAAVFGDDLEFCGYLRVGGQQLFILGDPVAGTSSEWLRTGQTFSGYTIGSFDAKSDSLTVTADGHTLTLVLKTGTTSEARAGNEPVGAISARLEMAKGVLRTMRTRYREAHPTVKAQVKYIAELEHKLADRQAEH